MIGIASDGSCLTLTINRPERRNALTNAMYTELDHALQAAQADPGCNAVILTGTGGHFTAGNDLSEFQSKRGAGDSPALAFLRRLAGIDVPVIAAVEGRAVGVGVTLLQHCDFVYAAQDALFSMPFVSLGLCPEGGSSLLMARIAGPRRAAEWLLLGKSFDAAQARDSGLITATTAPGQALERARQTAAELARQPGQALRDSKRLLRRADRPALEQAFDAERDLFTQRLASDEAQAAFRRFFESKKK
ncbi:MAG: enoyl-CoA hydratase-related protein [Burkholderiaceae bacterium]